MSWHFLIAAGVIILYAGAGLALAIGHLHSSRAWRVAGAVLALVALAGHGVMLCQQLLTPAGWDVNFFNSLSLSAALIVLILMLTALWTRTLEIGVLAFPGAALCVVLQWLVGPEPLLLGELSFAIELHVFSSLLAYSLLSIAALNAIVLAVQEHALRHRRPIRQLEMLPPLAMIERVLFRLVLAGWLLLTVSLASGWLFVDDLLAQHLVHKTVLSILSWLLFGLLLAGRWWLGWRGRKAVNWTLAAMFVLVLAYFGSKLVLEVMLERSWMLSGS